MRCPNIVLDDLDGGGGETRPARVSLIQMPNGTGKTTTLELLNATLSGEARSWDHERVLEFRRPGEDHGSGTFAVSLRVDGRLLTIELTLDFESGTVRYRTSNPGSGGLEDGYRPTAAVRRFLSPGFLSLFVFDGEFAERLFDPVKAEADDAVDALCQLYLLGEIGEFAENEWTLRTKQVGAKSDVTLTRLMQSRSTLSERREKVEAARASAESRAKAAEAAIADYQKKIDQRMSTVNTVQQEYAEALVAVSKTEGELAKAVSDVMLEIRQPLSIDARFGEWLVELRDNLDDLQLPENTSAQFFLDLAKRDACICGRDFTPGSRHQVELNAKQYLGSEEAGIINAIKKDVGDRTAEPSAPAEGDEPRPDLTALIECMSAARRAARAAVQTVDTLKLKLIQSGDEEFRAWQEAQDAQKETLRKCSDVLRDVAADRDDRPEEALWSLRTIDKLIDERGARIAELTKTVRLRRQTDKLRTILQRAREIARTRIREELVEVSNERLATILGNDPVRIQRIDRSIRLLNQNKASTGQSLAIGYVFLTAALSRGSNDFPLIVDSPANPIDAGRRRRIASLVPSLCTQFVGFIINTEFLGFVESLEKSASDVRYITIFRLTEGTARLMPGLPAEAIKTENAVVVEDRSYFLDFDMTEEGDD